jgi:hypothetical protein
LKKNSNSNFVHIGILFEFEFCSYMKFVQIKKSNLNFVHMQKKSNSIFSVLKMFRSEKYFGLKTTKKEKEFNYLLLGLISTADEGAPLGTTESRTHWARYRSSRLFCCRFPIGSQCPIRFCLVTLKKGFIWFFP